MRLTTLRLATLLFAPLLGFSVHAGDWTEYRGPRRDGTSPEKGLPDKWDPNGAGLLWKSAFGSRSTPVIHGGRLYMLNASGAGPTLQERVVCLDATTGKLLWEYKFNVYLSDVPPHRIAWSSPSVDAETGNVYVYGVGGTLLALTRDGKKVWERSLGEEVGLVTTHGGRTVSPVVEGGLVVVSGISSAWGEYARASHRFMAYDKKNGEMIWSTSAPGRPFDTTYSPPIVTEINGSKLLIAGGGDGAMTALRYNTGELVWTMPLSKRGINTGPVVYNNIVYASHSEENYDTSEMGILAAIDGAAKGTLTAANLKWQMKGFQGGFSTPVVDGDRLYQVDNGANLFAFDAVSGKRLWEQNLGTIQKASPVLADGKLYVGSENGTFYILKPTNTGCEILDKDELGGIHNNEPIAIYASAAVANGVVYVVTSKEIFAFGKPVRPAAAAKPAPATAGTGAPAYLLVTPNEVILKPGETVQYRARLFDAKGNPLPDATGAAFAGVLDVVPPVAHKFVAKSANVAGKMTAEFNGLKGEARVRVLPVAPFAENFDGKKPGPPPAYWTNATGKYQIRDEAGAATLAKLADNAFTKRARTFFGHADEHDYTVEADVKAVDRRRQLGDAGVVAQRYQLTLFGNHQRIELQSWQPETTRTQVVKFPWKGDTWYRLKLRVENQTGGRVRVQGKAWPAAEPEPAAWTIERVEDNGNREGAPGIYADAPNEVFFDNIKVTKN